MLGKKNARTIVVVSIGSGSVSVSVALSSTKTTVLASERRSLSMEKRSPKQTVAALRQQLLEILQKVTTELQARPNPPKIDEIYCIIRAPWTTSKLARAEKSFSKDEHITSSVISELAQQALVNSQTSETLHDVCVAKILLNGYHVKQAERKIAHHVEVFALISTCKPALRQVFRETLVTAFPGHVPIMRSGTRVLMEYLERSRPVSDCLILDFSEDGTACVVVRNGAFDTEFYVPEGIRTVLERAGKASPDELRQSLRMMARDECSQATCVAAETALVKIEPELAHIFGEQFTKEGAQRHLPNTVFLVAEPDMLPWLIRFFSRIDFTQFTTTSQPFDVTSLVESVDIEGASASGVDLLLTLINKELV